MNALTSPIPVRSATAGLLTVRVHPREEAMAEDAALAAHDYLKQVLQSQDQAAVIFACATSQVKFLAALTRLSGVDWGRVTVFHMDEYLGIHADHSASFRRFLREHLVDKAHPGKVHYIEGDALAPLTECQRYSDLLQEQAIDLCCLGIGENGHIAFNDPPVADFSDPRLIKLVKLDDASRRQQVGEGCYPHLDAVPQYSYTLTIPALCGARKMLCVVPEKRKAAAVKEALQGPVDTACPASFLRRQCHATLFLDADSASLVDWPALA